MNPPDRNSSAEGLHPKAEGANAVPPVLSRPAGVKPSPANHLVRALAIAVLSLAALVLFMNIGKFVRAGDHSTGWVESEEGVSYRNERIGYAPWSIHMVRVDRADKDLTFYSVLSENQVLGVSRISEQARLIPQEFGRPIAGVNGDFYERDNRTYVGDPRGLQIVRGELVSAPDTVCVWFDRDGAPHLDQVKGQFMVAWPNGAQSPFGLNRQRLPNSIVLYTSTYGRSHRVQGGRDLILQAADSGPWLPLEAGRQYRARVREVRETAPDSPLPTDAMVLSIGPSQLGKVPGVEPGALLDISTATTPDLAGVRMAIAGGPALIQNGKASGFAPPSRQVGSYSERSKYERHPRSAVGWNDQYVFLVTVDGRQAGLSVGMTLTELTDYMVKLGCTEAMNLDGGVSATMWLKGRIANDPCQGERSVANALFVVRKSRKTSPTL